MSFIQHYGDGGAPWYTGGRYCAFKENFNGNFWPKYQANSANAGNTKPVSSRAIIVKGSHLT